MPDPDSNAPARALPLRKLAVLTGVLILIGVGWFSARDQLTLARLAEHEVAFRDYRQAHPVLVYSSAFVLYVAVTGLSLPGATAMTLICGWLFGFFRAILLVSFASTAGATLAFVLSRYLFREAVEQRLGARIAGFHRAWKRDGPFYLFILRLIPAVPFFVINVAMGLLPIRTRTFWWVSQLGMLPGTAVYVYAGSVVPDLQTLSQRGVRGILSPQIVLAFAMLGVVPLILRSIVRRFSSAEEVHETADATETVASHS